MKAEAAINAAPTRMAAVRTIRRDLGQEASTSRVSRSRCSRGIATGMAVRSFNYYLSHPSPSLGPPLLSASWSPPLFCGIVQRVVDVTAVVGVVVVPLEPDELPHAPSVTASTSPPNMTMRRRIVDPFARFGHPSARLFLSLGGLAFAMMRCILRASGDGAQRK